MDRFRSTLSCLCRNSGGLIGIVLCFFLISLILDRRIDYLGLVQGLAANYFFVTAALVLAVAFLESLFLATFYFPGTTILVGILLFSKGSLAFFAYPLFSVFGCILGYSLTWLAFTCTSGRGEQVPHFAFARYTDRIPEKWGATLLAFQPSFLTSFYAYQGFRGRGLMPSIALSTVATLFFHYGYAVFVWLVPIDFARLADDHSYYVTAILLTLALGLSMPCFTCKQSRNIRIARGNQK